MLLENDSTRPAWICTFLNFWTGVTWNPRPRLEWCIVFLCLGALKRCLKWPHQTFWCSYIYKCMYTVIYIIYIHIQTITKQQIKSSQIKTTVCLSHASYLGISKFSLWVLQAVRWHQGKWGSKPLKYRRSNLPGSPPTTNKCKNATRSWSWHLSRGHGKDHQKSGQAIELVKIHFELFLLVRKSILGRSDATHFMIKNVSELSGLQAAGRFCEKYQYGKDQTGHLLFNDSNYQPTRPVVESLCFDLRSPKNIFLSALTI